MLTQFSDSEEAYWSAELCLYVNVQGTDVVEQTVSLNWYQQLM
jgi:hypothetical protein